MKTKYPKIGNIYSLGKTKGNCFICGENKSDTSVDVQVNCFRGDDYVVKVHKTCLKNGGYKIILDKYLASIGGKRKVDTDENNQRTN